MEDFAVIGPLVCARPGRSRDVREQDRSKRMEIAAQGERRPCPGQIDQDYVATSWHFEEIFQAANSFLARVHEGADPIALGDLHVAAWPKAAALEHEGTGSGRWSRKSPSSEIAGHSDYREADLDFLVKASRRGHCDRHGTLIGMLWSMDRDRPKVLAAGRGCTGCVLDAAVVAHFGSADDAPLEDTNVRPVLHQLNHRGRAVRRWC